MILLYLLLVLVVVCIVVFSNYVIFYVKKGKEFDEMLVYKIWNLSYSVDDYVY